MIDAYYEDQDEEESTSLSSSQQTVNSTPTNPTDVTNGCNSSDLTLAAIKDYLLAKNGKVRYSELNSHFKELGIDSNGNFFGFKWITIILFECAYDNNRH